MDLVDRLSDSQWTGPGVSHIILFFDFGRPWNTDTRLVSYLWMTDRRNPETTLLPETTAAERDAISRNKDAYPVVRFTDVRQETTFVHVTPVKFTVDNPNGTIKCVACMVPLLRELSLASILVRALSECLTFALCSCVGDLHAQVSGPE